MYISNKKYRTSLAPQKQKTKSFFRGPFFQGTIFPGIFYREIFFQATIFAGTFFRLTYSTIYSIYILHSLINVFSDKFYFHTRREFYGNFYHTWYGNLVFYGHSGDFCHTCACFYYECGNIRHTEYGNNSHTIDFHTVL